MGIQPFLIAHSKVGLERDLEPWILPNDAFPDLQDCYLWRGRIKKRQCYSALGRLNRLVGTTDGSGNATITLINAPLTSFGVSQFQVGSTTYQDPQPTNTPDTVTLLTNGPGTATLTRSTGVLTITGGPHLTNIFYYPGLPVMGLQSLESPTFGGENEETLIGFDTKFAYLNLNAGNAFQDLSFYRPNGAKFNWTGTDSEFFWTYNYAGAMWATNFNPGFQPIYNMTTAMGGDGLRWLDMDKTGWVNFLPPLTGAMANGTGSNYLMGCLIILPYKGRLICFNTIEGTGLGSPPTQESFPQRARWSQNGTPFNKNDPSGNVVPVPTFYNGGSDPLNQAWSSDITGKGGFLDAPTLEQIISAEFVYDALVVYFERSTWQLAYTGDALLPFIWVKINTELGCQSTFSIIPLNHHAIAFGNVGVHSCDTVDVKRIDQKIPDEVFNVQNINQGPQRVYGIRDYFNQLLYWTIPYLGQNSENSWQTDATALIYPNKILIYNYVEDSYSFFNDSFTCFGYYQPQTSITWSSNVSWSDYIPWVGPNEQAEFQNIVGGNQQGYVQVLNQNDFNAPSLLISNITPGTPTTTIISPNHNLQVGDFIQINAPQSSSGIKGIDGVIYQVAVVSDANTFTISTPIAPTGAYTGIGQITTVNNESILTKKFNPFIQEGTKVKLLYADLYFENAPNGQVSVNLYIDEDNSTAINASPLSPMSTVSTTITAISTTNPCVITVTNSSNIKLNDVIFVTNAGGMMEINNIAYVVTNISGNNLTVDVDSTLFTVYTSGGFVWDISKNTGNFVNLFPESTYQAAPSTNLAPTKLWKRIYFEETSQLFQLEITMNPNQMLCQPLVESNTTLHGIILWFSKSGRLINV